MTAVIDGFPSFSPKTDDTPLVVLGIESSCDETAVAVVRSDRTVIAEAVVSQLAEHTPYGGVVPEIAARAHLDAVEPLVALAMRQAHERAGIGFADLSAVAATGGPGLIGGVIVGVMAAKAIAAVHRKPFLAVNHLEGHALTARLSHDIAFPYLLLLVSGGHCQILAVEGVGRYRRLGTTIDDAAGEAFDKVAKMLGLGFPGGPAVQRAAEAGDPHRFDLPRPLKGRPGCDFSFSGLKTAVRQAVEKLPAGPLTAQDKADLAASFQRALVESILDRVERAIRQFRAEVPASDPRPPALVPALVVAGGVAANSALRAGLQSLADRQGLPYVAPPLAWCTDNAAMIAWAGIERLRLGQSDPLTYKPRPRWPLDPQAAAAGRGRGKY